MFVYTLYNDIACSSENIASNCRIISQQ